MAVAYEFEWCDTEERFDKLYDIGKAPSIGKVITLGGRKARRLPSVSAHQAPIVDDVNFKCWSCEPYTKGARHYDTDGQPLIRSRQEAEDFAAANGGTYHGARRRGSRSNPATGGEAAWTPEQRERAAEKVTAAKESGAIPMDAPNS